MNKRFYIRLAVALGVILQAYILTFDYLLPFSREIWRYRFQSATARAVYMAPYVMKDDADFLLFIRDKTPVNVTVYFFETYGIYSWKPFLQYLLFPRHINVCDQEDVENCIGDKKEGDVFVQTSDGLSFQIEDGELIFTPFMDSTFLGYFTLK